MKQFGLSTPKVRGKSSLKKEALTVALDIRKFEIELYWKRATYFWAFIAVALGGHIAVLGMKDISSNEKGDALLTTSCLGLVFSTAWYFVNRASKYWQENWEAHVDLLEDETIGPLYKTVLSDGKDKFRSLLAPYPFSVSKINQALSIFIVLLFSLLTGTTLYKFYKPGCPAELYASTIVTLSIFAIGFLRWGCKTSKNSHKTKAATQRTTSIK